jgi:16S rRNA (cytidine1402-2'-O)-methyltransferase
VLLLIPTPIGNLQDLSPRAIAALQECDVLFTEDTRMTKKLFSLYQIEYKTLISYHKHNEKESLSSALRFLNEGLKVGLVSDAGTPCIFDPGCLLVQEALKQGIQVSALPGPSSPITALSMSGLLFSRFQCIGFLPREKEAFEKELVEHLALYPGVSIALESPERILRCVERTSLLFPDWEIVLIKEISKLHETILKGPAIKVFDQLKTICCKGEWVVLFSERTAITSSLDKALLQVESLINEYQFSLKSAVQAVSHLLQLSKNELYSASLKKFGNSV